MRADRVVARLRAAGGRSSSSAMAIFSASWPRWLGLPASDARHYRLGTASLSVLGYEHSLDEPTILLWNDDRHAIS